MKLSQSLQLYSTLILIYSALAFAWPWPKFLPDIDSLIVREQGGGGSSSAAGSASNAAAQNTGSSAPSQTGSSASNSVTSGPSKSGASHSGSGSTSHPPTTTYHTSYDNANPAGAISMLTPAVISGPQYYKIGDNVTFGWNYTNLLATPTALDILASCSANKQIYTLATNQTISNATQAVTWDTSVYATGNVNMPLLTETYTLIIYDAASSISAIPQPGYLATFNQFTFGMYVPQPYADVGNGFQCATCSGALSDAERKALGFMLGMCVMTILSATWFVSGLDIAW